MSFRDKFAKKDEKKPVIVKKVKKEKAPDWNKRIEPDPSKVTVAVEPVIEKGVRKVVPVKTPKKVVKKRKPRTRKPKVEVPTQSTEELLKGITQVIQKELAESKKILEEVRVQTDIKSSEIVDLQATNLVLRQNLEKFLYNRKNLVLAIHDRVAVRQEWKKRRKPKGIKADNLMPRFGTQVTRDVIQADIRKLKKEGILLVKVDGWYNFTRKGLKYVEELRNETN